MARTKRNKKPSGPKKTDEERAALKVDRVRRKAQRKQEMMRHRQKREAAEQNQNRKPKSKQSNHPTADSTPPTSSTANPPPHPKLKTTYSLPFHPTSHLLLLGEADFSFSRSLIQTHNVYSLCATTFESASSTAEKYSPQGPENANYISDEGFDGRVLYSVDATKLHTDKQIQKDLSTHVDKPMYDMIIFNFPHIGGKSTDVNRQVRSNQQLLVGFFQSAKKLILSSPSASSSDPPENTTTTITTTTTSSTPLPPTGEEVTFTYIPPHTHFTPSPSNLSSSPTSHPTTKILVTLFTSEPYTLWNVRDLARHCGLVVETSFPFEAEAYPGYKHARTLGNIEGGGGWKGEEREGRCYVFGLRKEEDSGDKAEGGGKKRKKGAERERCGEE